MLLQKTIRTDTNQVNKDLEGDILRIIDKSVNEEKDFGDIGLDDIFKYDDRIFMKVSHSCDNEPNAYDFTKGRLTNISDDTKVKYVPSELILHERGWDCRTEQVDIG